MDMRLELLEKTVRLVSQCMNTITYERHKKCTSVGCDRNIHHAGRGIVEGEGIFPSEI